MTMMHYKGYLGSAEFDEEERVFHGKLEYIRALVTYEATDADGLVNAFHEAADSYLELCKRKSYTPEIPFKGSFNIRPGPELHRQAAIAASHAGISLNAFVTKALSAFLNKIGKNIPID
jgi:predicted HicB family RNase H-like nuclease